jgi:hypothetical protein
MGIMKTGSIFAALLAAAALLKKPVQDVASKSLKDAYDSAKAYLLRKFGEGSEAARALEMATTKPECAIRKMLLVEESASADLGSDPELSRLVEKLAALLPAADLLGGQNVRVTGRGNQVQVAGRDIVTTERLVHRNAITPDARHITPDERRQLGSVISELAYRLVGPDGRPRYSAVHAMLQRRFEVPSYLLIPRDRFDDALAFLKQQRAIHRSRLRRRNPVAYRNDYLRLINARCCELGWDKPRLHQFASEKLGLRRPVNSSTELGPNQLKSLVDLLRVQAVQSGNVDEL